VFHGEEGEGRISAAVRTGEKHEVSEGVGMRKVGMPNPEISWLRESRLEEDQGRKDFSLFGREY